LRIDILTSISGVSTSRAMEGPDVFDLDGRAIPVIAFEALLANKRAANREQDQADVVALERLRTAKR
jgi:hypothetical protein